MLFFDNLNKSISGLGLPGNLGLLTTGIGLLEGQNPLQAVQAGLGTYGALSEDEERRRRKGALAKLGEQYANDPRLKAIIDADPEAGLSLIAQLEAQKRRPRAPTLLSQRKQLADALGLEPGSDGYNRVLQTGSSAAPAITTAKDADGFLRNVDTGERIFPDATGKTNKPVLSNVGGTLYDVTDPSNPTVVVAAKDDPKTAKIGDKLYNITDINNPTLIVDETPAQKPVLSNVGGTLYNVTDPSNPTVVVAAKDGPKTANIGGTLYDISDINNPKVVVAGKDDPVNPNVKNYVADQDVTIGNQTYTAGTVFAVNQNDPDALGAVLEAGGRLAPTRTESTVTNTSADAVVPTGSVADSPVSTIDINTAAGGDLAGVATDILNKSLGFAFGASFDPKRTDAKANLAALENAVLPGLVKSISTTGAVRSQQDAKRLIPAAGDTNPEMRAKVERLLPVLNAKLVEAVSAQKQEKLTPTQRTLAQQVISTYPNLIATLEETLKEYEKAGITAAGSSAFSAADAIVK